MAESREAAVARLLREGLNFYGMGQVAQALRCWREVLVLDPGNGEAQDYVQTAAPVESATGTRELDPEAIGGPSGKGDSAGHWEFPPELPAPRSPIAAPPPRPAAPTRPPTPATKPAAAAQPAPAAKPNAAAKPSAAPAAPPRRGAPPTRGGDPSDALLADAQRLVAEGQLEAALDLLEALTRKDPSRLEAQSYLDTLRSRLLKSYRERLGDGISVPRVQLDLEHVLKFNLPPHAGFVLSLVDGATCVEDLVSLSGMDAFEALRLLSSLVDAGIVEVGR